MKKKYDIWGRVVAVFLLMGALFLVVLFCESKNVTEEAIFIFAGTKEDADCSIILSKGSCVVIDTGEAQDGEHIAEILKNYGVQKIDCILLTHPDKDHVGGTSYLLEHFPVMQVIVPYFEGEKESYQECMEKIENMEIPVQVLSESRLYTYGEVEFRVFAPEKSYYEKSNNYSLAIYAKHGESILFWAGDAQKKRIKELLSIDLVPVQLYHVAYHGRDTELSNQLIERLVPKYAIVTAKSPEQESKALLEQQGAQIFSTLGHDQTFISDGKNVIFAPDYGIVTHSFWYSSK